MCKKMPMVPFITRWKFGMAFIGERGAECSFNSIERAYSRIPNQVERLFRVVQEHHHLVQPENAPTIKRCCDHLNKLYTIEMFNGTTSNHYDTHTNIYIILNALFTYYKKVATIQDIVILLNNRNQCFLFAFLFSSRGACTWIPFVIFPLSLFNLLSAFMC